MLPKPFPAKLAGGCAAGHGAGMKGLAKRSPAAGLLWGWQGARGSGHRAGCRHCPGRLLATSSHPQCCALPELPARADRAGTPCKDPRLQRDQEAKAVLRCSQHGMRSWALVGLHGTSNVSPPSPVPLLVILSKLGLCLWDADPWCSGAAAASQVGLVKTAEDLCPEPQCECPLLQVGILSPRLDSAWHQPPPCLLRSWTIYQGEQSQQCPSSSWRLKSSQGEEHTW